MKEVWYKADEGDWEDRLPLITKAIESGFDYILVDSEDVEKVRELGDIKVAAYVDDATYMGNDPDDEEQDGEVDADTVVIGKHGEGDGTVGFPPDLSGSSDLTKIRQIKRNTDESVASYVRIMSKDYEEFASRAAKDSDYVVVIGEDWKIIPLENLIAEVQEYEAKLIAGVDSAEEAETAFETLEVGADGVLLDTDDPNEIKKVGEAKEEADSEEVGLTTATVTKVEPTGMGDRVCVDTASLMEPGEGMLVGSMSGGLFLVHAETAESPYVSSRPFRVNAGAVHAYIRVPGGETKYLSELEAGDEVLIVDENGETREAIVGRSKIEKRPMMVVEAEVEKNGETKLFRTLLQNAETIKLVTANGPKAVTELEEGDKVMINLEGGGRHFGMKVEESVVEK